MEKDVANPKKPQGPRRTGLNPQVFAPGKSRPSLGLSFPHCALRQLDPLTLKARPSGACRLHPAAC